MSTLIRRSLSASSAASRQQANFVARATQAAAIVSAQTDADPKFQRAPDRTKRLPEAPVALAIVEIDHETAGRGCPMRTRLAQLARTFTSAKFPHVRGLTLALVDAKSSNPEDLSSRVAIALFACQSALDADPELATRAQLHTVEILAALWAAAGASRVPQDPAFLASLVATSDSRTARVFFTSPVLRQE